MAGKSIRRRLSGTYVAVILSFFVALSGISFYYIHVSIQYHSSAAMNSLSRQKVAELNACIEDVEKVARAVSEYVSERVEVNRFLEDRAYREEFLDGASGFAQQLLPLSPAAKTLAVAFDPAMFGKGSSRYIIDAKESARHAHSYFRIGFEPANYRDDDPAVSWLYGAKVERRPIWIGPVENGNLEDHSVVLSHAVPVLLGNSFIGAVAIDVELSSFRRIIDNMDYEAGFGFLVNLNGDFVCHRDFPVGLKTDSGDAGADAGELSELRDFLSFEFINTGSNYPYRWRGVKERLTLNSLENGMLLAVSVPEEELMRIQKEMFTRLSLILGLALVIVIVITNVISRNIILPIRNLTAAASRIAHGELNLTITYRSDDELGTLADSIRKISVEMKDYIGYISAQAYTDAMTGIRNKAAYIERTRLLDRRIDEQMANFAVYVFDVNGLKRMNDSLGHEAGDALIKDAAGVLKLVFGEESVYRTGGDEFVAIEDDVSEADVRSRLAAFDSELSLFNAENDGYASDLAVSKGAALYIEESDENFAAVAARADKAMYEDKEKFYQSHPGERRR